MNYQQSGVSIDTGNQAVERIKPIIKKTLSTQVLGGLGGFAGGFELPQGYQQPVLVACTDGVGTKLKWGIEENELEGLGVDLVAMCVNDLICCGAKPLFFLDYIAVHQLDPKQIERLVAGMASACEEVGCSIIGGEMAEMSDMYQKGDFDLAGFSVGVVEKNDMITGEDIQEGDFIYALPSSGLHSNGFSLVRAVLTPEKLKAIGKTKRDFLTPTRLYVNEVLDIIGKYQIKGLAHITGGGLDENIQRVLPKGLVPQIKRDKMSVPEVFSLIQSLGEISDKEMQRVFNMGIGMVLISSDELDKTSEWIQIGKVTQG